ncbi:MAG: hypothetical protein A4E73_03365 [Syntrophaceae bacterium PtaU1.Bin231]|nr:MAG: hypothetical protein A4E73_03365 [Syntrophaceae bacterium PtaU1.Bin231]
MQACGFSIIFTIPFSRGIKGVFELSILPFSRLPSSGHNWTGAPRVGGNSWHDAREYYYRALTDANPAARLLWFEKTFRALGQIMHLVEDAAVPEHVRNDLWHGPKSLLGMRDTFEQWTDEHLAAFADLPIPTFSDRDLQQIFGEPGDPHAPVPISRLVDMNLVRRGDRPGLTGTTIAGIAEYANTNFLSRDTIFQVYEHPSLESTEPMEGEYYLRKVREGERIEHFVRSGGLDEEKTFTLDPACYHDYASLLVPKAIACASLIPYYFFRPIGFRQSIHCACDDYRCFATGEGVLSVYNPTSEPIRGGQLEVYTGREQRRLVMTIPIGYLPPCSPQDANSHCAPFLSIGIGDGSEFWGEDVIAVFRGTLGQEGGLSCWVISMPAARTDARETCQAPLDVRQRAGSHGSAQRRMAKVAGWNHACVSCSFPSSSAKTS